MASPLEDLDELILRCRDSNSREYIREAVASYRAGAFRAAIVGAWIAVCFDLMEKFRELALAGDGEADKLVQELDAMRRDEDLSRALKFERTLLQTAKEKFELISHLEFIDLERLQKDRNRCAHPSLTADDKAYAPAAELARLHIHSAVCHLLQHPPVQGKYALERLVQEISSEYFPSELESTLASLRSGPLAMPRESLVRNLVLVLLKRVLQEKRDFKLAHRIRVSLQAIEVLHPEYFTNALSADLSKVFRASSDGDLCDHLLVVTRLECAWECLDDDVRYLLQNFVRALPAKHLNLLPLLFSHRAFTEAARYRLHLTKRTEVAETYFFPLIPEIGDWMIAVFLGTTSLEEADGWAQILQTYITIVSGDHVRKILIGASKNRVVASSFHLGPLISDLRNSKRIPEDEFERLLCEHNLIADLL